MARNRGIPHVALLIETSQAYGRCLIEGIVQYVRERGPWSIQFEERGLQDPPPRWLKGWRGDGIITRTTTRALANAIRGTGAPTVELCDHASGGLEVGCDHPAIGRMAAEHLFDQGLRHFAFFAYGEALWIRFNREAFVRDLARRGYDCHIYQPPRTRSTFIPQWEQSQHARVVAWVRSLPRPLGMLCASDLHALPVLNACRQLRIAVPEQIAVLGVTNDTVICGVTDPPLSSIDLNSQRIGYEAAALLSRRMSGRARKGTPIYVPPSHIATRQSTDVLAIGDQDVAEAIRFIRQTAQKKIRVSEVADAVGLSRRVLERRFLDFLGRSPKAEIVRVQVEHAKMLLTQSDLPIEAIAAQCGVSFQYFGQLFRRETGVTPRAFRHAQREIKIF
jgi:LacI family transcriptional regulator